MILDQLGRLHGTDKASTGHDYLKWYEPFLAPWRDMEFVLLEMGVGGGPSVRMWRDYFPRAQIIGFDNDPSKQEHAEERIKIVLGDQSNPQDLDRLRQMGPFGVINDDAGHQEAHQLLAYERLLPALAPGGVYLLEDIGGHQVIDRLITVARDVMQGNKSGHPIDIESIGFYRGTSATVRAGIREDRSKRWEDLKRESLQLIEEQFNKYVQHI